MRGAKEGAPTREPSGGGSGWAPPGGGCYLFSIDLEDVRDFMSDGEKYRERVPAMTRVYLDFLDDLGMKATFFVVGLVARSYPSLIREIAQEGHELACHSDLHTPVTEHTPETFRADLRSNVEAIEKACGQRPTGFRAPTFSVTERTPWAHGILGELGFAYSSSVLPARNPLYGWPSFGEEAREVAGVWEIPMTLSGGWPLSVPFGGGVYFRALPGWYVRRCFKRARSSGAAVTGYFHPYDIDVGQERFMHPEIDESRFFNWLLYRNRDQVLGRLRTVVDSGWEILRYDEFVRVALCG